MIFRSPFPDIEIPTVSLTAYALRHADRLADKPALIDAATGRTMTYGEVAESVRKVAASLAERGYRKGDVVAIAGVNSIEYVIGFHAILTIGGIAAPVNPQLTVSEIAYQLRESGAVGILLDPDVLSRACEAAAGTGLREFFVIGDAEGATPFADLLRSEGSRPSVTIQPRKDVAVILCSSGTTGLPKGVQLTHFNVIAAACQMGAVTRVGEGEALPGHLPFFHIFGVGTTLSLGLAQGAVSVLIPRFDLACFLQVVQDHRVRHTFVVPPIVVALAKDPIVDHYDLSALTSLTCGAASLGEETARLCAARLGCQIKQGYGMSETGGTHVAPDGCDPAKIGTVGPCTPNTECKVIDIATGAELGPGAEGELWVRTPAMMKGYLNRPEETARTIDPDGWLHTGDIGWADADGYVTIVDRLKELIKYKAHGVAPAELEAALLAHPAVADAAVIASPDPDAGEVPKAFVVLKEDATPEELMAFVAARVAPYKKVRRLEIVDQIPKSPSGKILRRVLVAREREREAQQDLVGTTLRRRWVKPATAS